LPERRPRPGADDPHLRGRRGSHPPLGRRRDRLGLRGAGGARGVARQGQAAARARRRAPGGSGSRLMLLAVAVAGRGIVAAEEPVVHADDEALLRGRAAFETMRVYRGRPFRLQDHLQRMRGSAARLGIPWPSGFEELAREALAAAGERDAVLRLYLTAGREGTGTPAAMALVSAL